MFYIDNISSEDLMIYASNEDFLSRAPINYEEIQIDGKHGSQFIEKNYMNKVGSTKIYLQSDNLDELFPLFTGKHELKVNDRVTEIYFYDILETSRYSKHNAFGVNYIRAPFWYKAEDDFVLCTDKVTNEGNVESQPIIKLVGSGKVDVTVGTVRFVYDFGDETEVIIDCKEMKETYDGLSRSKNMEIGFKYPVLVPGDNLITVNSGDVEIYIKRKDAWL